MANEMMRSMTASDGYSFDPNGRLVPSPSIPVFPRLDLSDFLASRLNSSIPSPLDHEGAVFLRDGRSAIYHALRLSGVMPGDEVLVPEFHCLAMINPVLALKARPVLYRLNPDLNADVADIGARIGPRTRAILVSHYFGFPNAIAEVRSLVKQHGVRLIEDCAHALFGIAEGQPIGSFGDFAITSLRKFLPVKNGATLSSISGSIPFTGQAQPNTLQIAKSVFSTYLGQRSGSSFLAQLSRWRQALLTYAHRARNPDCGTSSSSDMYARERSHALPTPATIFLTMRFNRSHIALRRRAAYNTIVQLCVNLERFGVRPFIPELPAGVVPFMVPLWVDRLGTIFRALEDAALPMQRFGQFLWVEGTCPPREAALSLSQNLLQIPCHQSLRRTELEWMIETIRKVCFKYL